MGARCHRLIVPLTEATDGTGPGLEALKDDEQAPDGKPEAEGADGQYEMEGVAYPPPAKDPGEMAATAKHGAVLMVVRGHERRLVDFRRLIGDVRFPDGVFVHGRTVRRSTAGAKTR